MLIAAIREEGFKPTAEASTGVAVALAPQRQDTKRPLISFNTTNYNTAPITRDSLESIVSRMKGWDYEIVCTDNFSDDGSYEALAEYRDKGYPIRLIRAKCGRGLGRQIALKQTRGEIIVTFDLDTVYSDEWKRLLEWYVARRPDYVLIASYSGFYPKAALDAVGGWRDVYWYEDIDLWVRLATKGLWRTYPMRCGENHKRVPPTLRKKTPRIYGRIRDTVAFTAWVPWRLYWRGYGQIFPPRKRFSRSLYYRLLLLVSYLPARIRRYRLTSRDFDPSTMFRPEVFVDCGIVQGQDLRPVVSKYDTREGVLTAAAKGDWGFLPGTYD